MTALGGSALILWHWPLARHSTTVMVDISHSITNILWYPCRRSIAPVPIPSWFRARAAYAWCTLPTKDDTIQHQRAHLPPLVYRRCQRSSCRSARPPPSCRTSRRAYEIQGEGVQLSAIAQSHSDDGYAGTVVITAGLCGVREARWHAMRLCGPVRPQEPKYP